MSSGSRMFDTEADSAVREYYSKGRDHDSYRVCWQVRYSVILSAWPKMSRLCDSLSDAVVSVLFNETFAEEATHDGVCIYVCADCVYRLLI